MFFVWCNITKKIKVLEDTNLLIYNSFNWSMIIFWEDFINPIVFCDAESCHNKTFMLSLNDFCQDNRPQNELKYMIWNYDLDMLILWSVQINGHLAVVVLAN